VTPSIPPAVAAMLPNPAAEAFVSQAKINGVRLGMRVLLNGNVYNLGDIVNADLKLKITAIEPRLLTFTDESGYKYTKRY
jgi:hypothetical protein